MGCDWYIYIQARYGKEWSTVYSFESKTRCGGYPIRKGLSDLSQNDNGIFNAGAYGIEYKTDTPFDKDGGHLEYSGEYEDNEYQLTKLNEKYDEIGHLRKKIKDDNKPPESKKVKTEGDDDDRDGDILEPTEVTLERSRLKAAMKKLEDQYKKAGMIGCYPAHHMYLLSIPQYKMMIENMLTFEYESTNYGKMLSPISKWAEMMQTASPSEDRPPWMDDSEEFVSTITKDIIKLQEKSNERMLEEKCNVSSNLNLVAVKYKLPVDVTRKILLYLGADDMRIAIYDDEHNSERIRGGDFSEPAPCVVM